jgi:hypothetical protein
MVLRKSEKVVRGSEYVK